MPGLNPLALMLLAGIPTLDAPLRLDVPFQAQMENGCGAACIVMVLRYWQPQSPPEDPGTILHSLFEPRSNGIPAVRMEEYFRARRYRTFAFRGNWSDVAQHLAKGRPLIVSVRTRPSAQAHYVVVAGIDPRKGLVQMNDPARGKLVRMRREDFERAWRECDCYTLLVLPPTDS